MCSLKHRGAGRIDRAASVRSIGDLFKQLFGLVFVLHQLLKQYKIIIMNGKGVPGSHPWMQPRAGRQSPVQ